MLLRWTWDRQWSGNIRQESLRRMLTLAVNQQSLLPFFCLHNDSHFTKVYLHPSPAPNFYINKDSQLCPRRFHLVWTIVEVRHPRYNLQVPGYASVHKSLSNPCLPDSSRSNSFILLVTILATTYGTSTVDNQARSEDCHVSPFITIIFTATFNF